MDPVALRAIVAGELRKFNDENAQQLAERHEINIEEAPSGWLIYQGNGWGIGYSLDPRWADTPWCYVTGLPDEPVVDLYAPELEPCFQYMIYPDGIPTPEAQTKIDANIEARQRLIRKSLARRRQKQGKKRNKNKRKSR